MTTKATTLLLLLAAAAAAFLCHVHVAVAAADPEPCDPSDITIATVKTGRVVGGLPEFQVTIGNECSCPEGDVVLSCPDGVPAGVDRSKIHAAGGSDGLCLVNDGLQIVKGSPVVFTYAAQRAHQPRLRQRHAAVPALSLAAGVPLIVCIIFHRNDLFFLCNWSSGWADLLNGK
ncbi:hypothetical protein OsI_35582 [Oryza sativa Indica Group]|uniref:Uncharacterized protein n=1 Tax=Oryza sativa subsp. indica TaxID=39946 RepID=A2ZCS1_ORYSI|nr:hypothetical protein OsI_35582 [Oryza sativa Indica Group]